MNNKLLKIGYYVFLGFLGIIALAVVISALPITGGIKILAVLSGSMEPTIHTGSIVIVRPHATYRMGDVVTFKSIGTKNISITHRVVEMRVDRGEPSYVTKGDANNAADTRVILQKEVIGSVIFSIPYLGYAIEVARKPYGFLALIIIPALIIVFDQIGKIVKEVKKVKAGKKTEEIV